MSDIQCGRCGKSFESSRALNGHIGGKHEGGGNLKVDKEKLIKEVKRLAEEVGRRPTVDDVREKSTYSYKPFRNAFDSWPDALSSAGFEPRFRGDAGPSLSHHAYGYEWLEKREEAISRDGGQCVKCGINRETHKKRFGVDLNVHHKIPRKTFENPEDGDTIDNLVTLCAECHGVVENLLEGDLP